VRDEITSLQHAVDALLGGRIAPVVLEAGCGSLSHLKFPHDTLLVGIDIAQDQLDRNKQLSERVCGDVQTYDLGASRFDAIVCWDVLEHLEHPEQALVRFARALRDDGIIVLSAPNPFSPKGLATKLTPYAFHLWFYRNVRGWKEAGTRGNPPFHTFLRSSMAPGAIRRFAARHGLSVAHDRAAGSGDSIDIVGRKRWKVDLVIVPINLLLLVGTLGRVDARKTQYFIILHKKPDARIGAH
jgi:SAM-dependent methyltransferase